MSIKKPCYIWDPLLISQCDRLPAVPDRASVVNDLITAYELNNNLQVIRSIPASYNDLKKFHSELYLDHLKSFHELEEDYMTNDKDEEYGIGNGVEDAYKLSKSVFTLSFHKYEPGFYPGSGNIDDIGSLAGKGGYNHPNAARLWTKLTAVVAGVNLDDNIPEHDHWPKYGPDYILSIQPSLTKDLNTEQYINECISKIKYNLKLLDTKTAIYLPLKRKQDREEDIQNDSQHNFVHKQDLREGNLKKETRLNPVKAQVVPEKDNKAVDVYDFQD
ncbi:Histone deacetylase 8 [Papilio machaon]|uniref:histone deacetylase n=1 Tax=Papilio machaon TaxID=76193 RepID=A0A0N1I977_PAPMA|nr:Histone deacetylase 8 [Papilio machaon]